LESLRGKRVMKLLRPYGPLYGRGKWEACKTGM
jgi:hypothetical protein